MVFSRAAKYKKLIKRRAALAAARKDELRPLTQVISNWVLYNNWNFLWYNVISSRLKSSKRPRSPRRSTWSLLRGSRRWSWRPRKRPKATQEQRSSRDTTSDTFPPPCRSYRYYLRSNLSKNHQVINLGFFSLEIWPSGSDKMKCKKTVNVWGYGLRKWNKLHPE